MVDIEKEAQQAEKEAEKIARMSERELTQFLKSIEEVDEDE